MSEPQPVENIWVNVAEGAQKTGFHPDHVRRLARENWRLPEAKRAIRLRKASNEYSLWLPDLMNHVTRHNPFADQSNSQPIEEIWVMTFEASEITGYNRVYLQQLAKKISHMPEEDERPIQVRSRSGRYEFWLPDLVAYLDKPRRGPRPQKQT